MNKSERRYSRRLLRPMLAFAALAALAIVLAPTGSAKPPTASVKLYDVCLQGGTAACTSWNTAGGSTSTISGTNPQIAFNVHNESGSNTTLGSLNVDMPSGVTLQLPVGAPGDPITGTSTSTQLQLRNLNLAPGASYLATFTISAPSVCETVQWNVAAKQSNDFNGSGNDFQLKQSSGLTSLITAGCKLAFTDASGNPRNPASAIVNKTITDTAYTSLANGANNVTVVAEDSSGNVLTTLNSGAVTLTKAAGTDDCTSTTTGCGSTHGFDGSSSLGQQASFVNGVATFTSLKSDRTGSGYKLQAASDGFQSATSSPAFNITNVGMTCDPRASCDLPTNDSSGSPLDINGSSGFTFLGESPFTLPQNPDGTVSEPGCQNLYPVSGSGFAELDGRTNANGTLTVTIFVDMKKIKAKYGANTGQQFIPICIGVKYLDSSGNPVDCSDTATATNLPNAAWKGDEISNSGTKSVFTGLEHDAACGSGGYWWGIVSSYQDKLDTNPPTSNPEVTSWTSVTMGNTTYREFVLTLPPGLDLKGGY